MLHFFRKKKDDKLKEPLRGFQASFSMKQKAAIIAAMIKISNADGEVHPSEKKFTGQIALLLGIELYDPVFLEAFKSVKDNFYSVLKTFDKDQIDWFVTAMYSMVVIDGKSEEVEIDQMFCICDAMNLSEDDLVEIIQKAKAVGNIFR